MVAIPDRSELKGLVANLWPTQVTTEGFVQACKLVKQNRGFCNKKKQLKIGQIIGTLLLKDNSSTENQQKHSQKLLQW